ncbi:threonine/serine exporter family protein, partial [Cellulomonas sp. RIT-PI-Y]|uniref:threonine/serine ThrE exporter family protein n=1 Tax=Cellulomonas sp. RIT-PI-Y TaxID=3035297 RepID=UPI0021D84C25
EQPTTVPSATPESTAPASPSPEPTSTSTVPAPGWLSRPAAADSSLPWGMVLVAVLVLVAAAAGLVWWWRGGAPTPRSGARGAAAAAGAGAGGQSGAGHRAGSAAGESRRAQSATTASLPLGGGVASGTTADDDTVELAAVPEEPGSAGAGPAGVGSGGLGSAGGDPVDAGSAGIDQEPATEDPAVTGMIAVVAVDEAAGTMPAVAANAGADPATGTPTESADPELTVRFLVRLGEAMVDSSSPIAQVNGTLERVAAVNGLPGTAVVTFPTALMVSVPDGQTVRTAVATAGSRSLRLDQVADVLDLAQSAVRGDLRPAAGLAQLSAILESPPPSTGRRRALGYVVVAAGLSLVLGGGWLDVLISAVLGGLVSVVTRLTRRMPVVYQGLLTGACAFLVAVPVFLLVRTGWSVGLLAPLVGPLVTFLPGALLTTGVIDLATRQMIAGSARLAAGVMQLVLLALGITAAAGLVGVPSTEVGSSGGHPLGWAAPWIGVLVYAVGVVLNNDARTAALPWITLVLVVAYAGQVVGGLLLGASVSSFVGALAMTPVAMVAATRRTGPPFLVTFLPGFWVLVPGALGLVGVTSALDGVSDQAITTIVTTGVSMVAICLGVLAGLALGSGLQRRLAPDVPPLI